MSASDLEQIVEQDHRALDAFVKGDPEPKKRLYSKGDDATLANPLGPPARGWNQIAETLERAASQVLDGEVVGIERISEYETPDLAYILEIEHSRMKIGGAKEMASVSLRATTIYRRQDDGWRIVHRHADPITTPRLVESVLER